MCMLIPMIPAKPRPCLDPLGLWPVPSFPSHKHWTNRSRVFAHTFEGLNQHIFSHQVCFHSSPPLWTDSSDCFRLCFVSLERSDRLSTRFLYKQDASWSRWLKTPRTPPVWNSITTRRCAAGWTHYNGLHNGSHCLTFLQWCGYFHPFKSSRVSLRICPGPDRVWAARLIGFRCSGDPTGQRASSSSIQVK